MKLQAVHNGTVYATEYRRILVDGAGEVGELPVPVGGVAGLDYRLKTGPPLKPLVERYVGQFPTVNLWRVTDTILVATANRWLFVSYDAGRTWDVSRELPVSSGIMGVLPTGFCEHEGTWYLGEYVLDSGTTPRVLHSDDRGSTWTTELRLPDVRHVHSIQPDPYTGDLWITTGDVGEECVIGRLSEAGLDILGQGDQRWRAVELAFTPSSLIWGVDSVYEEQKHILRVARDDFDKPAPPVETLHTVSSSVYYSTTLTVDGVHWVVFSTAMEPGTDSTAPPSRRNASFSESASVVAASSETGFAEWHEFASYEKQRTPADVHPLWGHTPPANAYVFLSSDPDRGLFINPYNTMTDRGSIRNFPMSYFANRS